MMNSERKRLSEKRDHLKEARVARAAQAPAAPRTVNDLHLAQELLREDHLVRAVAAGERDGVVVQQATSGVGGRKRTVRLTPEQIRLQSARKKKRKKKNKGPKPATQPPRSIQAMFSSQ
jgi:hypothetical protein